jgi:hypothetical protein
MAETQDKQVVNIIEKIQDLKKSIEQLQELEENWTEEKTDAIKEQVQAVKAKIDELNRVLQVDNPTTTPTADPSTESAVGGARKVRRGRQRGGQAAATTAAASATTTDATSADTAAASRNYSEYITAPDMTKIYSSSTTLTGQDPMVTATAGTAQMLNTHGSFTANSLAGQVMISRDVSNVITPRLGGGGRRRTSKPKKA